MKVYQVPDEIQPYLSTFIIEAHKRGHRLIIDDLIVSYERNLFTAGIHAAGICRTKHGHTPIIYIDTTSLNWKNSDESREQLVFHEFGHCILGRSHTKDTLQNGAPASIMKPSGETLYGSVMSYFKREYYLNELFNPGTDRPSWAQTAESDARKFELGDTIFYENFQIDSLIDSVRTDSLLMQDSVYSKIWSLGENFASNRRILNSKYELESYKKGTYFVPINLELPADSSFEIRIVFTFHGVSRGSFTWYWGGRSVKDVFAFVVNRNGDINIGQISKGVLMTRYKTPFFLNKPNEMVIRRHRQNYLFYMNGFLIDRLNFEPYNGNLSGFGLSGNPSKVWIDNILVTQIKEK